MVKEKLGKPDTYTRVLFQGVPSVPMRIMELNEIKFPVTVRKSVDVLKVVDDIRRADRETFVVLHLNAKNIIISREIVSVGTIDSAAVYPREVLKSCILNNASSVILAHNHPSGDCHPSESDKQITRDLIGLLILAQIRTLDHVIVGQGEKSFSFADSGLLADYISLITLNFNNCGLMASEVGGDHE
ncbi:hypothetical protein LCGC14_0460850 [marine sediment metagenome]|uniref:MPN domain-containing protein n=1 Tax=marine sediment metagenome TaxID=412755 RepID=A0A0F9VNX2_9ZZZZ